MNISLKVKVIMIKRKDIKHVLGELFIFHVIFQWHNIRLDTGKIIIFIIFKLFLYRF